MILTTVSLSIRIIALFFLAYGSSAVAHEFSDPLESCQFPHTPERFINDSNLELKYYFCVDSKKNAIDFFSKPVMGIYSGLWFDQKGKKNLYQVHEDYLEIYYGSSISTAHPSLDGRGTFLSGARSFYVSVTYKNSICSSSAFSAIWLMPRQHNFKLEDIYDEHFQFEEWFELDIDEGSFSDFMHGTAISWSGTWPNYTKIQNPHHYSAMPIVRCKYNDVGVFYDSNNLSVQWFLNGVKQGEAHYPFVPLIARHQDFYLIVGAQANRSISNFSVFLKKIEFYQ